MPLPPAWYQFGIGVFASLGSYLYGYDLGVIAEVVASPTFSAKFKADPTQQGLVVSMFTTGAFFGAAFGGPSGDWLGRRLTIVVGAVIFCLGGGLQTGAQNVSFLYAGRFIAGLGVGFLVMVWLCNVQDFYSGVLLTLSTLDRTPLPSRTLPPKD